MNGRTGDAMTCSMLDANKNTGKPNLPETIATKHHVRILTCFTNWHTWFSDLTCSWKASMSKGLLTLKFQVAFCTFTFWWHPNVFTNGKRTYWSRAAGSVISLQHAWYIYSEQVSVLQKLHQYSCPFHSTWRMKVPNKWLKPCASSSTQWPWWTSGFFKIV